MSDGGEGRSRGRLLLVSLAITVPLLALLLSQTDVHAIIASFRGFSPVALVLGLVVWGFHNLLRAWRFQLLVKSRDVGVRRLFSIVNIQNLLATLTPGRAGEISYVVLLHREGRVPSAEGFAGLVVARAFDFVAATGIVLICLWSARGLIPSASTAILLSALVLFGISLATLFSLVWLTSTGVRAFRAVLDRTGLGRFALARKVASKAGEVHDHVVSMHRGGITGKMVLLTAAIWIVSYAISLIWIYGLALPVTFIGALFVSVVAGLAVSLPVQGVAGLGTTEAGWAIPLIFLGIARDEAVAAGFCFHALAVLYLLVLAGGGYMHLYLGTSPRPKTATKE